MGKKGSIIMEIDLIENIELRDKILSCFHKFSLREKIILLSRIKYGYDFDFTDIGEIFELTHDQTTKVYHYCFQKIKECLNG